METKLTKKKTTARAMKDAALAATGPRAARANELLALIARRVLRIAEDFFDIGVALNELKDKKLFATLGYRNFDELLAKRAPLGRSQAYKLMAIVKHVARGEALVLGEEKAYAVARLVAATPADDTVADVIDGAVRIGKDRRRAAEMSTREIVAAKRALERGHAKRDPEERDAKRAVKAAHARLAAKGVEAEVEAVRKNREWWAVIRVKVEDLPAVVGRG